jgi:hypothetical protein
MTMTRRSHGKGIAILAATSAALAMVESRPAHAGCTKDVECKGVRICENGRCVYPPPAVGTPGPGEAASPGAATTSAAPAAGSSPAIVPPVDTAAPSVPPTRTTDAPSVSAPVVAAPVPPAPAAPAADVAVSPGGAVPGPSLVAARASWIYPPGRHSPLEMGGFGFGIHDGNAGAFGGGVQAGYRFSRWLAIGAWLEGSGQRERPMVRGRAAYRLYDLGLGLTVGETVGPIFGDLSVLPELTLLTVEGRNLNPGKSVTRWGAAADARLRLGLVLGPWRPFVFGAGSYALLAYRLTLDDYPEQSTTLSRRNAILGLGLAYCFGAARSGETIARRPSPGLGE